MKLQPTRCCSCSYYTLMLYYTFAWSFSITWPDPISCRGTIACSISAYSASDNAPMQTGVWRHKTRSFMPSALPYGHFNPIASVLLSKSFNTSLRQMATIHHVSTNSASADSASLEYKFKSLDTFLTLNCNNVHYWIVLFFMNYILPYSFN